MNVNTKKYIDTYIYTKGDYEQAIFNAVMSYNRIDKHGKAFENVEYDVKRRQTTSILVKVLANPSVVLLHNQNRPMSQAFKVFPAKDVRGDKKMKIFIDVSDIFRDKNGEWVCSNIDVLIARLVSAMTNFVYYSDTHRVVNNSNISVLGATIYSKLMTNIIDNLFKISVVDSQKTACMYLAAKFYLVNILEKDPESSTVFNVAVKASGISEARAKTLEIYEEEDSYQNIKTFIELLSTTLKIKKLQLDNVVDKWVYIYGRGTHFGLELFPSFAAMSTDAYANAYINNQKTIEKLLEVYMVDFTKTIFDLGQTYFR